MKPHLLKVSVGPQYSFSIRRDCVAYFYNRLHFHPELELVYIHKGAGTQFMGSTISRFEAGDMVLVGSNLTHMWRCDQEYQEENTTAAEATVIHFHPHFLGNHFFQLPEHQAFLSLLKRAEQGLRIDGKTKEGTYRLMCKLLTAGACDRVILLLHILRRLATSKELKVIASRDYTLDQSKAETIRLNAIYNYVLQNFQERITLRQVAAVAHISPKSFCRYFKSHTRKTFCSFLIEVRIAHACKLLQAEDKTVYEVCYESGFNNLSNFNRFFKKLIGKTPIEYKKQGVGQKIKT